MKDSCVIVCAVALLISLPALCAGEERVGFSGMEIYKLDFDSHSVRIADVNGDGLNDIVVANNARARIECLIQRADPSAPLPPKTMGVNELPDDRRFQQRLSLIHI